MKNSCLYHLLHQTEFSGERHDRRRHEFKHYYPSFSIIPLALDQDEHQSTQSELYLHPDRQSGLED